MPKPKHTSLWPSSLKATQDFDIKGFLQTQARDLKRLVNDAFDVVIETRVVESLFVYNFTIELPRRDYRYQLFSIRMVGDAFPARIVAPHLPEPRQVIPVSDKAELEQSLRLLFHDPSTTKIVVALAGEGRDTDDEVSSAAPG
jgi:hypothetical protein